MDKYKVGTSTIAAAVFMLLISLSLLLLTDTDDVATAALVGGTVAWFLMFWIPAKAYRDGYADGVNGDAAAEDEGFEEERGEAQEWIRRGTAGVRIRRIRMVRTGNPPTYRGKPGDQP